MASSVTRYHIDFSNYQLNAQFFYSSTIYMLHYAPQHVSSSTLLILRTNCISTASGIVTLCKQPYSMRVESGLQHICYTTLLNMFPAARCSSSGGPIVSPQPLVSSPSVSSRKVCGCSPLSTRILYGCLQRVTIPEAVVIQLVRLRMSSVLLETC